MKRCKEVGRTDATIEVKAFFDSLTITFLTKSMLK